MYKGTFLSGHQTNRAKIVKFDTLCVSVDSTFNDSWKEKNKQEIC